MLDDYSKKYVINLESLNLCWKIFADTQNNLEDFKKYTARKGENAVLSGYCKMDAMNSIPKKQLKRKGAMFIIKSKQYLRVFFVFICITVL